jgi:hypothetical protein
MRIFSDVSRKTAALLGYAYPIISEQYAEEQIKKLTSQTFTPA